jgi:hypothetical protein
LGVDLRLSTFSPPYSINILVARYKKTKNPADVYALSRARY